MREFDLRRSVHSSALVLGLTQYRDEDTARWQNLYSTSSQNPCSRNRGLSASQFKGLSNFRKAKELSNDNEIKHEVLL